MNETLMAVAITALAVYEMLSHATATLWRMPSSHKTYRGFAVALLTDTITHTALWLYASAVAPESPLRYAFLVGSVAHVFYLSIFTFTPRIYGKIHDIGQPSLFADGQLVATKRVAVTIDTLICGLEVLFMLRNARGSTLTTALAVIGGFLSYAYVWRKVWSARSGVPVPSA